MAKATFIPEITKIVVDQEEKIILELTINEAKAIKLLTGSCVGNYTDTPKEFTDRIWGQLNQIKQIKMPENYHKTYTIDLNKLDKNFNLKF